MTPPTSAAECEACREMKKDYPTGLGPMYGDPENNYGKFDIVLTAQAHHHHEAVQDARIRELEAQVSDGLDSWPSFGITNGQRQWRLQAKTALARSSEVPK